MTAEQVGIYFLLLCEQWDGGPIPDDGDEFARMAKAGKLEVRTVLTRCFTLTDAGWVNERLEEIHKEQQTKARTRKRAGRAGAKARWDKGKDGNRITGAMRPQSDSNAIRTEQNRTDKKRTKTTFPEGWEPTEKHASLARELDLNPTYQADAFEAHAIANGRMLVDWNAGFRMWLQKANEFNGGKPAQRDIVKEMHEAKARMDRKQIGRGS